MDLTVSFPCITSESSTYAHARLHEEYSIVQFFFRERPSFCMHGWLKLVIMPVGPTPVQHISWSPIKKRRENSLFDTREMTRSFLGSQKNFVPYLTPSLTFIPYMTLRCIFHPATVNCAVKRRFAPVGPTTLLPPLLQAAASSPRRRGRGRRRRGPPSRCRGTSSTGGGRGARDRRRRRRTCRPRTCVVVRGKQREISVDLVSRA